MTERNLAAQPTSTLITELTVAGFLDAATGNGARRGSGDYAAIATVGVDGVGYYYFLDLWMRRASPTAQIAAVFDLNAKWRYDVFGIETNCFQQVLLLPLEEERQRRRAAGETDAWRLPIREVHHRQNKEARIATLEPKLSNGWLRFAADLPDLFWSQLESFPQGRHDDGPDALEGAIALLQDLHVSARRGPRRKSARTMTGF